MKNKENKGPVRVAQVIGKWFGGGVEAIVMNYYKNIDKSKIQFDFICDNDSTDIPYKEIESLGGRVILIPPYQNINKYNRELEKIFKENNYKIVHSHINVLSIFPLRIAKKCGVPVRIAHSHSTTNKNEWWRNLLKQILRPFSKIYATDYYACSEYAGRWLFGNKTYDEGKVYLLNNAIDISKFKYDEKIRNRKREELGISEDTLVIGHVGRFVKQKNHDFLIDIFNEIYKENKNSKLLLIGQGPLNEEVKAKVNTLRLQSQVRFLGQRDDVNELYQVMDVFVLPSLYEGLPVAGVEAQTAGLFCVFSDKITKEAKLIDLTKYISIDRSEREWALEIFNGLKNFKRKNTENIVISKGFDIKNEADKLVEKDLEYLER